MIYIILLLLVLYIVDVYLHLKVYGKYTSKEIEDKQEIEIESEYQEYTCFICKKTFSSCIIYNKNRALCGEDCKRLYVNGGFK